MRLTITGTVKDSNKEKQTVSIFNEEVEEMILRKAKEMGIKGYEGRLLRHFDETIISVLIDD